MDLLDGIKNTIFLEETVGNPEQARCKIAQSCLLGEPITLQDLVHLAHSQNL